MTKVLVGSKNPVKINSVNEVFKKYFEKVQVTGLDVKSKVSAQPVKEETFDGAKNRALALLEINKKENLNADFFVGVEGGITEIYSRWFAFGCMCIMDNEMRTGFGTSAHFELPGKIVSELLNGKELGDVMDKIQDAENTKQKHGAIGFFTNGKISRTDLYIPGLITALIPFLHKDLFKN